VKCAEVVQLMTEYLDGALSASERARFEEHIAGCDGCREYLAQLRTASSLAGKLAGEPVPEHLRAELLRAFRNWKSR
jgi:anti-sigma factor (TIGR02949 family)